MTHSATPIEPAPRPRDDRGKFVSATGAPSKPRRGGQPGNWNRARYVWDVVWRRGMATLPPEFSAIGPAMRDYAPELLEHLGGEATFPQRRLIENAKLAATCQMLILTFVGKVPVKTDSAKQPMLNEALSALPRFVELETRALMALGLERKAKRVPTLHDYLAEREAAQAAAAAPQASAPDLTAARASGAPIAPGRACGDAA